MVKVFSFRKAETYQPILSKILPILVVLCLLAGCREEEPEKAASQKQPQVSQHVDEQGGSSQPAGMPEQQITITSAPTPEKKEEIKSQEASQATNPDSSQISAVPSNNIPLTPEEQDRADKILAFCNQAMATIQGGYFALPDHLHHRTLYYLNTFSLPKSPKIPSRSYAVQKLTPPKGLFDHQEAKDLTAGLDGMNKVLVEMLGHYRELEKYVGDDTIRDDGRRGRELAEALKNGHAEYMKARRTWLERVEANAERAEQALLRQHPLQRQILAASGLFAQFREASNLLKMDPPEKASLEAVEQSILSLLEAADKPPFNASPELERFYRGFLKEAWDYSQILQRGIAEGFFPPQKREIAIAAQKCRTAYNRFAKEANRLRK